jgi:protein-S-isoprenylcysteine O-methyltransferase Ste14
MRATEFEFRQRFWLIGGIFGLGFALNAADHQTIVDYAVREIAQLTGAQARTAFQLVLGAASGLLFAAALLRTWATSYLRTEVMQDSRLRADSVVADGPYRFVRNPLYLGSMMLALAVSVLASRIGAIVIIAGLVIFYSRLIRLEEANIEREQGERYRQFCRRVPRLMPSLTPRVPPTGARPRWAQAFVGEVFMWGFFAAEATLAITLNVTAFFALMGAGLVIHILVGYWLEGQRRKRRPA